ncbi:beta strand repeat-containing protein [Ottowia flava]|uniref:beta strand repeat-containing protein n=1 Tax=Ottowia sp. GY511 TaxID=2603274 RepID=UPI00164F0D6F|nr:IPTL-CTERM sorting domain-containing protein [Ottowia sp. GY511]
MALALPSVSHAFDGGFSVVDQTIQGTGCPVAFISQSSSGTASVQFISYDRQAGGSVWNVNSIQSYPTYVPPGSPPGTPPSGGPVTVADLEACGLSNVINLAQNGADGPSRAADAYMGFSFRATQSGVIYDYEVAIKGASGTQVVNTRTPVSAPTIVLAPAALPGSTVGVAYSQTVTASGGVAPYSFALTGALPAGLAFNSVTGVLSGTPSTAGSFPISVSATDSGVHLGSQSYVLNVAPPTITVTPVSVPAGTVGVGYSQSVSATGGIAPYTYGVAGGALPAGLSLSTIGLITGVPTAGGSFNFTLRATSNSTGVGAPHSGTRSYTLVINPPTIGVTPATLPAATAGAAYSQNLSASGGTAGYTFAVTAGTLPPGMTLSSAGVLSGTSTASNTFNFTVTATDSSTGTGPYPGSRAYTLQVMAPGVTVLPATLPNGAVGSAYSQSFSATGGTAPYTYSLAVGPLPPGLTLSAGVLSGTPTSGGTFSFSVRAIDATTGPAAPYSGERAYTVTIGPPTITVAPSTLPSAAVASTYSQTVTASGGTAPYQYTVTAGALPAGLALSTAGVISGTPTAAGSFNFTVSARDSSAGAGPYTGSQAYTLTVSAPTITLTPGTLAAAAVGSAYSQTLTASGGVSPYTYSVSAGALPAGLALSPAGVLSGTPTAGGDFIFSVRARDSSTGTGAPFEATVAYTLTVAKAAQTLTFPAQSPASHTYASAGTFAINPPATSDAPANPVRPIVYSSLTTGVCTVAGTTVTMVASGACTLAADQAGDTSYLAAAQVTQTVMIDGIKSFSGTTVPGPGGTAGPASASFTGGGAACGFDAAGTGFEAASAAPPPGKVLPQGMFRFRLTGCDTGSTVTMTVTWPQAVGEYGKYGRETVGAAGSTWFTPPGLAISGNSASFTITDGGVGDGDGADGVIADPTGPLAAAPPVVVPTLGAWALALLAGLLGLLGRRRWRTA